MLARIDAETRLVYICNPHNPTGRVTRPAGSGGVSSQASADDRRADRRGLPSLRRRVVGVRVVHRSPLRLRRSGVAQGRPFDSRVIVTRSFSKIHGLAGLRVGYAVAAADTARVLASHRLSDGCECRGGQGRRRGTRRHRARADERQPEHRRPAGVSQSGDRADAPAGFADQFRHARHRPSGGRGRRALQETRHSRLRPRATDSIRTSACPGDARRHARVLARRGTS